MTDTFRVNASAQEQRAEYEKNPSSSGPAVDLFSQWQATNQAHISRLIEWVLVSFDAVRNEESGHCTLADINKGFVCDPPTAFNVLVQQFDLNEGDQAALALVLAMSFDDRVAAKCAMVTESSRRSHPTATLAFSVSHDCDWGSFSPHSPLRYWLLLEWQPIGNGDATLVVDERILNFLRGINYLDERLAVMLEPMPAVASDASLSYSQSRGLQSALTYIQQSHQHQLNLHQSHPHQSHRQQVVIEFFGEDKPSKTLMAAALAHQLGATVQILHATSLPTQPNDLDALARLWQREAGLMPLLLLIEGADDPARLRQLQQFVGRVGGLVMIDAGVMPIGVTPNSFPLLVERPTVEEQEGLWRNAIQGANESLPARLSEQFSLSQQDINQMTLIAESGGGESLLHSDPRFEKALWTCCQQRAASSLAKLAQRIDCKASWQTLVLPPAQTKMLDQLTAQVGLRSRVYQQWGFRHRMSRGMGISAMFCGDSGTGKTMAAEAIANELGLDLYRIDLSSVISKYIGDTEKKMRELFQAAEQCGAILFFDEADALFGKRSEVKNSNDRFANIGIDDLLQRIETYRGLAILATNLKSSVDKAFLRRLRFVVDFPFPGPLERERIWFTAFPPETPLSADVNPTRLSRLNLTGGSIHNVALNGAFLAAQHGDSVSMQWLMEAAAAELQKLDRPIKAGDLEYE
ncbi:AAA family ATPase [Enterovibrio norvegicus FF-162]|uniref:AAA family ATPase n=1 Tax=Enterovibrio norvegicus FF-454 TaxID=1185651 RepID=A0A1E5BWN4_9GAMM|nr:ATP-binding protein [Enterovibrio norvegicus]OEE57668.1 AAA family ATPase [Enterovibrio norvegicus FF-454]OEE82121.1 AAA family ATPase [Enterovibrio norvegicus FF-162]